MYVKSALLMLAINLPGKDVPAGPSPVPIDLDGERLSCVACRGIYKRSAMTAYDWDGNSLSVRWMFDTTNTTVSTVFQGLSFSHLAWWTGTLERSLVSGTDVASYSLKDKARSLLAECDGVTTINSTKAVPALQGDILGDWREELIFPTLDGRALRIFISPEPTEYRFHTFLEDPVYRHSIAHQNGCYNQPTQPGFYFGPDLKGHGIWFRGCRIP